MFGKQTKKKEEAKGNPATVRLNARLQPLDRAHFDPLDDLLQRLGIGEICGGGTQTAEEPAGIAFSDLELRLKDVSRQTILTVVGELDRLGAPKGSKLIFDSMPQAIAREAGSDTSIIALDEVEAIAIGIAEGLALFLNGTDLPDDVYKTSDVNQVIEECVRLMGDGHFYWSYWQGSRETGLYFYGRSFEQMDKAITPLVASHPLCQKSRIEQIA